MNDETDWDRVDAAALAVLSLTQHDHGRVWKNIDWNITDRLHEKGWISDPKSKAKSVWLTPEGEDYARKAFAELFTKTPR